jgi:hypothetical protein
MKGQAQLLGSVCTTCCWTNPAARASWTGRAPARTRSACAPSGGLPDRPEPDRPRQTRLQLPPAGRPRRHLGGRRPVGRQHPRLPGAGTDGRRRARGQGAARSAWSSAPAAGQVARRQGLRLPALPADAQAARHHPQDRPPWRRVQRQTGPHRYVVERSLAWLVGYRRLQVRTSGAPTSCSGLCSWPARSSASST